MNKKNERKEITNQTKLTNIMGLGQSQQLTAENLSLHPAAVTIASNHEGIGEQQNISSFVLQPSATRKIRITWKTNTQRYWAHVSIRQEIVNYEILRNDKRFKIELVASDEEAAVTSQLTVTG